MNFSRFWSWLAGDLLYEELMISGNKLVEAFKALLKVKLYVPWLKISVSSKKTEKSDKNEHVFFRSAVILGSRRDCDVMLGDLNHEFEIERRGIRYYLKKRNGAGEITGSSEVAELYDGDRIDLGPVELKIEHGNFSVAFYLVILVSLFLLAFPVFMSSSLDVKTPRGCFETGSLVRHVATKTFSNGEDRSEKKETEPARFEKKIKKPSKNAKKIPEPDLNSFEVKDPVRSERRPASKVEDEPMRHEALDLRGLLDTYCRHDLSSALDENSCAIATEVGETVKKGKSEMISGDLAASKKSLTRSLEFAKGLKQSQDLNGAISELLAEVLAYSAESEYDKENHEKALDLLLEALKYDPKEERATRLRSKMETLLKNIYIEAYIIESSEPKKAYGLYERITRLADKESDIYAKSKEKLKNLDIDAD